MGEAVGSHPDPLHAGVDLQMHRVIIGPSAHQSIQTGHIVDGRRQSSEDDPLREARALLTEQQHRRVDAGIAESLTLIDRRHAESGCSGRERGPGDRCVPMPVGAGLDHRPYPRRGHPLDGERDIVGDGVEVDDDLCPIRCGPVSRGVLVCAHSATT